MSITKLFDSATGYAPVTNLLALGDPKVPKVGDQWWMYFGAADTSISVNIYTASLPPGAPLSSDDWTITTAPDDPTRAVPLVTPGPAGTWNEWLHTPSYVRGPAPDGTGEVERIYVTASEPGGDERFDERSYTIGMLERRDGEWHCRPEPILRGASPRRNVLEPAALWSEGKWRLWLMATPKEAGPGELPDYQIHYYESDDGITGWSEPQVVFDERDNYYDAVVLAAAAGYEMIVTRAPNLFGTAGFPTQGLWWLRGDRPSGLRADWSAHPVQLIDADHGADWYRSGIYGPSLTYGDTAADQETLYVFFTGASDPGPHFYRMSVGRLAIPRSELRAAIDPA